MSLQLLTKELHSQALADALGIRICVLTSFPGSDFIEIVPADEKLRSTRSLYVSFWAEVSYHFLDRLLVLRAMLLAA